MIETISRGYPYKPKDKINIVPIYDECSLSENLKIVFTPSHTPSHVPLVVNEQIILAGDSLKTYNDYIYDDFYGNAWNKNQYLKTKKNIKHNFKVIYSGHDSVIINGTRGMPMHITEF